MKSLPLLLALSLSLVACSKKEEKEPETKPAPTQPAEEKTVEKKAEPVAPTEAPAEESADYLRVQISHAKPKPTDPVHLEFQEFKVVESKFDPANIEGATATIEVAIASLKSDKAGRDEHLMQSDYLDQAAFPTARAVVSEVAKKGEAYTANVAMTIHGQEQTWQVDFELVESTETSVTIQFEHTFSRTSFGIGTPESSPADEVILRGRLRFDA